MGYNCCTTEYEAPRHFLTAEEKIEMLEEYKQSLETEAKGVQEAIERLRKK